MNTINIDLPLNGYVLSDVLHSLMQHKFRNQIETIKKLLSHGADPNCYNGSPLILAVKSNNLKFVDLLLSNGADPQIQQNFPLIWAASHGYLDIAKSLVSAGANVNALDGKPLIMAIKNEHFEMVKFLIESGADVNADNGEPLIQAVKLKSFPLVKLLLLAGVKVNVRNDEIKHIVSENYFIDWYDMRVIKIARLLYYYDVECGSLLNLNPPDLSFLTTDECLINHEPIEYHDAYYKCDSNHVYSESAFDLWLLQSGNLVLKCLLCGKHMKMFFNENKKPIKEKPVTTKELVVYSTPKDEISFPYSNPTLDIMGSIPRPLSLIPEEQWKTNLKTYFRRIRATNPGRSYCRQITGRIYRRHFEETETPEPLKVGLIKNISGDEVIQARELIRPQFRLLLLCNDPPSIPSHEPGIREPWM